LEKTRDQQTRAVSKTALVEQINRCLRSGDYSRALDLLRSTATEFANDAQLSELERLAQDGVKRALEAQRLITQSQELFAQQKSLEAIQLLREAYELDKKNSLARAILANALVEHAHSMVETDWWEAETLINQALAVNPAHPTAKTIGSLIVDRKKASSVEDWVARARKLQFSSDPFAALAWVAEGLAVHPDDPKLLQIHDAIQRDQGARRRQARRVDVEDLRRIELAINEATDVAAKQALAERIQAMAAKYWTDGEILAIANRLLQRLGFVPQERSSASPHSKGAAVIFHVPRPNAPAAPRETTSDTAPGPVSASAVPPQKVPTAAALPSDVPPSKVVPSEVGPHKVPPNNAPPSLVLTTPPKPQVVSPQAAISAADTSEPPARITPPPSPPKQPTSSNSTSLILVSAAAIILVATTFFFTRRHYAPPVAKTQSVAPTDSMPAVSTPVPVPSVSAAVVSPLAQTIPQPSSTAVHVSSDTAAAKVAPTDSPVNAPPVNNQPPSDSGHKLGTLLVVAGQDDARVLLDGKPQPQLTHAGQLRLPNLELKDYVVQVSKSGFQDPPQQKIRIHQGEQAKLVFSLQPQSLQPQNLQPQPRLASLTIQGGAPATTVLVDQNPVGAIQPDGTLSVSVNPGDRTVELRKEGFKPRQLKRHFVAGGTISLAAADAALEAAPGELKITFAPADAKVALVKGDLLQMVSSGVPLNLAAGTYTLTARTSERFTRSSTVEVIAGQSKILDLSLAPNGMSKWENPGAWKQEKDSFIRKGGDFVLYGVAPASGTFVFSAMLTKGRLLQWVLNYSDPKNYVLFQMDDNSFYRTVIRNGEKTDGIKVPDKSDMKSFSTVQIRVSPMGIVHQIKHGDSWIVLDRWTQPGADLSRGKFGFYIPGNDQVALSSFAHYVDLNIH
jgi:Flp pilus assembly protein TadD